jgi:hypothetical protein
MKSKISDLNLQGLSAVAQATCPPKPLRGEGWKAETMNNELRTIVIINM